MNYFVLKLLFDSQRTSSRSRILIFSAILGLLSMVPAAQVFAAVPFVVTSPEKTFIPPVIVFPDDKATDLSVAFDYDELSKTSQIQNRYEQINPALEAVRYLREGIFEMTGRKLPVIRSVDKSKGIVFTTLEQAPPDIQNSPEIQAALRNTGEDSYNANEAFFIRTESDRILIVTNTIDGFNHAVVELLESVGYEVLGMGPNWTSIPDFREKPLEFNLEEAGRPGFYIRQLGLTSGQGHGIGTIFNIPLSDPNDETVEISFNRWAIGTHIIGNSMPYFLGHAMPKYAQAVAKKREELGTTDGFLNKPDAPISFDGVKTLVEEGGTKRSVKLDKSVPFVRELLLEDFIKKSEAFFSDPETDGQVFLFGTDPEDGVQPHEFTRYPNWYPEYLEKEKIPFGKPYVLNGFRGLNQPKEIWDPASFTDTTFGFNNWLLWEYDQWIDSLPEEQRKTRAGQNKKDMVRASLYSYNAHDVPPNFNLDPRIRVMIAGYPKHRGHGKWKNFASQIDMAQAFQIMLPNEPSGDYLIDSISYYRDFETRGIGGSDLAETIQKRFRKEYDAGIRAISVETDLNFGKLGLEYYLDSKMLWNPKLTATELIALRDRWFQRAYGNGWQKMREYYDFLSPENYTVNAPNNWAKAIQMIASADQKIDPQKEPAAQRRLDDLKQYWYYYYLRESGEITSHPETLREFVWKGQMSYMTPMHMVTRRFFKSVKQRPAEIAGEEFNTGPAHYTPEETAAWWNKIRNFWKVTPVTEFAATTLANGEPAGEIDVNDLVAVAEFQTDQPAAPFFYNSGSQKNASFLSIATHSGDELGFKLTWPFKPDNRHFRAKDLFYGVDRWDPKTKSWDELEDVSMVSSASKPVKGRKGVEAQLVEVRYSAPLPGTYRFRLGYGGDNSYLGSLSYDPETGESPAVKINAHGFTFADTLSAVYQGPSWIYLPKGVKTLDLEVWRARKRILVLHNGLPSTGLKKTRTIDISEIGTHTVKLEPGEDGSMAMLEDGVIYFPYLYSVPMLWAKSTPALLVPREIATADGLTIVE